jgi:Holliday junction resolvasome RuvABC endonuclease subunit
LTFNGNILGLDVSTNIIGYTILTDEGVQIESGFCDLDAKKSTVQKAAQFHDVLRKINGRYHIASVWIEEPFMMFAKGGSSAQTMSKLSSFNGMVQYACLDVFGADPNMINANHARKTLGIKIQREKVCGISTKEQIMSWVKLQLPDFAWPTKTLKSGPRKGLTIPAPSCYDIADSYVVAKSGFVKMNG